MDFKVRDEKIGERIAEVRQRCGLNQKQLADRLQVSDRTTISRIEAGKAYVSSTQLSAIADICKVPLSELIPYTHDSIDTVLLRASLVPDNSEQNTKNNYIDKISTLAHIMNMQQRLLTYASMLDILKTETNQK